MRHYLLTRSVYGPSWDLEANKRRLAMTEGVTVRSLASQGGFEWIVLVHPRDPLLPQRMRAFGDAQFLFLEADDAPSTVAFAAYRAPWADAIGDRGELVAMTRLDDDDAFAPWAMERIQTMATKVKRRTALVFPRGIRVWDGGFTLVRHTSNAMQTLVTPPGDTLTVYDYGHREVRKHAPVLELDNRPAWLWARHQDTISGWRFSDQSLTPKVKALFDVDWSLFGEARAQPSHQLSARGRCFR